MNVSHLAVIVPVDGLPQDMEEANQEVWGTAFAPPGEMLCKILSGKKSMGIQGPGDLWRRSGKNHPGPVFASLF